MTKARPAKEKMLSGPCAAPVTLTQARFSHPAFGPPSRIQPIAPMKGGIRKEPSTSAWNTLAPGRLVRDTPQAIGTAITAAIAEAAAPSSSEFTSACT